MLREVIFLNGIYDMACAATHLLGHRGNSWLLSRLHADMLEPEIQQRMLAYWIFTYGIVRLAAFSSALQSWECMVSCSYSAEAAAYALEGFYFGTVDKKKAAWVSLTSIALATAAAVCS